MKHLFMLLLMVATIFSFTAKAQYDDPNSMRRNLLFQGVPAATTGTKAAIVWNATRSAIETQSMVLPLFVQTASVTVAAGTKDTTLLSTGIGSLSIPANFLVAGTQLRLTIKGVYTSSASSIPTEKVKLKIAGIAVDSATITGFPINQTNSDFDMTCLITCRTAGASGTLMITGSINYSVGPNLAPYHVAINSGTSTNAINTTLARPIDVSVTGSLSTAGNSMTVLNCSLEALN